MHKASQLTVAFPLLAVASGYAALEWPRHPALTGSARSRIPLVVSAATVVVSSWCTHLIGVWVLTGRNALGAVAGVVGSTCMPTSEDGA